MSLGSQLNATLGTQAALAILGDLDPAATAAGTAQSTAYAIFAANTIFTSVGTGAGGRLPVTPTVSAKDRLHVANYGANTLAIYPPTSGKLNNLTANVPALIAPNKCADFFCIDGTSYSVIISA